MFRSNLTRLAAFASLVSALAYAQFGVPLNRDETHSQPARIREMVAQYCRLDFEGARLDPQDWPKVKPLVAWHNNPDFPIINVISRFTIDDQPVTERSKYLITVHNRLIGRFTVGEGFSRETAGSVEDVVFTVAQVNGDWRITDIEPNYPHPSRAVMLKWLNSNLAKAQDATSKTIYQHAISDLQTAASPSPLAQ